MKHGRIAWLRPDELDADQLHLYEAITGGPRASESAFQLVDGEGRLEGPFNAMLLAPALGRAVQELGAAIRYRSSLTGREREIAILALAAARRSEFEWYAHVRVARRIGMTEAELEDISSGEVSESLNQAERCVVAVVQSLVTDRDLDDTLFAYASDTLGFQRLSEVVTLVGYYDQLALGLRVWRTPLPRGADPQFGLEAVERLDRAHSEGDR